MGRGGVGGKGWGGRKHTSVSKRQRFQQAHHPLGWPKGRGPHKFIEEL